MQERIATPVITAPGQPRPWVENPPVVMTQQPLLNPQERAALYAQYVIDARIAEEKRSLRAMAQQHSAQEQAYMNNMLSIPQTYQRIPLA